VPSTRSRRSRILIRLAVTLVAAVVVLVGGSLAAAPLLERYGIYVVPPSPQRYADIALDRMTEGLEWDAATAEAVRARVDAQVAAVSSYAATYEALRGAVPELGGPHSAFLTPDEAARDFRGAPPAPGTVEPRPTVSTADGITTIVVPTLVGGDDAAHQRYVDAGAQGLVDAAPATTRGWVVDLRGNHGGDMWPMLAALSPLLDEGRVMSFEHADRSLPITVQGGAVADDGAERATSGAGRVPAGLPVAVLTDGMTGSSGEAAAIAFVGQEGVRSFGQPTYGFSTVNQPITLIDGAVVNLTVAVDADRSGKRYGVPVEPDVVVDDAGITAAVEAWFDAPR
jgi:carboxyl-terminal processing protease